MSNAGGQPFGVELPENLGQDLKNDSPDDGASNEGQSPLGESPVVSDRKAAPSEAAQAILDLDKVEQRFRLNGKEWEKKDLLDSLLRQDDYTRKSQALAEQRKYATNFPFDMAKVMSGQATIEQFASVYSKAPELIRIARQMVGGSQEKPTSSRTEEKGNPEVEKLLEAKLSPVLEYINSQKERETQAAIDTAKVELDSIFSEMEKKFPDANSELVNSRLLAALQAGHDVVDENGKFKKNVIERLFEKNQSEITERYAKRYGEQVKKQKEANSRGIDAGKGGGVPGSAPQKARNLKDVRALLETDIAAGRLS
jgi:hypothetical protein